MSPTASDEFTAAAKDLNAAGGIAESASAQQLFAASGLENFEPTNQFVALSGGDGERGTLFRGQSITEIIPGRLVTDGKTSLLGQLQSSLATSRDVLLGTYYAPISGNLGEAHWFEETSINPTTGVAGLFNPSSANSTGNGLAESFLVPFTTLAADNAWFYAGAGAMATG